MQVIEPHETGRVQELRFAAMHSDNVKRMVRFRSLTGVKAMMEQEADSRDWAAMLAEGYRTNRRQDGGSR